MIANLALDLVLQRFSNKAKRVDVLDFGLGAEFFLAARPHADVGVAAQRTFFHVAVADPGVKNDFFKPREVFVSLLWRAHVGFADDLDQRHAGAVQIDGGLMGGIGEASCRLLPASSSRCRRVMPIFFLPPCHRDRFRSSRTRPAACHTARSGSPWAGRDKNNFCGRRWKVSLMRQFSAIAASTANSTAFRFSTGRAPGSPRQTGQTLVFGGVAKTGRAGQKIFVSVRSWTWTSSPMTGSYFARRSSETAGMVAITEIIAGAAVRGMRPSLPSVMKATVSSLAARSSIFPSGFRSTSTHCLSRRAPPSGRSWRRPADSRCR